METQRVVHTKELELTLTVTTGRFAKEEIVISGELPAVLQADAKQIAEKVKEIKKGLEVE